MLYTPILIVLFSLWSCRCLFGHLKQSYMCLFVCHLWCCRFVEWWKQVKQGVIVIVEVNLGAHVHHGRSWLGHRGNIEKDKILQSCWTWFIAWAIWRRNKLNIKYGLVALIKLNKKWTLIHLHFAFVFTHLKNIFRVYI